ncbi:hypothetical protein LK10_10285 [Sinomonas humi]|uniref:Uncharacterized protein n=1 Tax=Sinomonas humi TaxID=1338436 RepID=A0A0B2AMM2_9MICC|nr:hypothetical protein LK10_10285 [Sinomonas humi]
MNAQPTPAVDVPAPLSSDERDVFLSTHNLPDHGFDDWSRNGKDITYFLEMVDSRNLALLRDILAKREVPADILTTIVMRTWRKEHGNDMFNALLLARELRREGGIPIADEEYEERGDGFVSACIGLMHNYSPSHKEPMPRIETAAELKGAAAVIQFIGAVGTDSPAIKRARTYSSNGTTDWNLAIVNPHLDKFLRVNPLLVGQVASFVRVNEIGTSNASLSTLLEHLKSEGYEFTLPQARTKRSVPAEQADEEEPPPTLITDGQIVRSLKRTLGVRDEALFDELEPMLPELFDLLREHYEQLDKIASMIENNWLPDPEAIRGRVEGTKLPKSAQYLLRGEANRERLAYYLTEEGHALAGSWVEHAEAGRIDAAIEALHDKDIVLLTNALREGIIDADSCWEIVRNSNGIRYNIVRECVLLARALPDLKLDPTFLVEVVNGLRHAADYPHPVFDPLDMSSEEQISRYAAVARAIHYYDQNHRDARYDLSPNLVRNRRTQSHEMRGRQLREETAEIIMEHPETAERVIRLLLEEGIHRREDVLARLFADEGSEDAK